MSGEPEAFNAKTAIGILEDASVYIESKEDLRAYTEMTPGKKILVDLVRAIVWLQGLEKELSGNPGALAAEARAATNSALILQAYLKAVAVFPVAEGKTVADLLKEQDHKLWFALQTAGIE